MPVLPTARSFGNVVRYLSMIGDPRTGALGVDVGASNTTLGAAFNGKLQTTVRSDIGSAFGGLRLLNEAKVAERGALAAFPVVGQRTGSVCHRQRTAPAHHSTRWASSC